MTSRPNTTNNGATLTAAKAVGCRVVGVRVGEIRAGCEELGRCRGIEVIA
jgi:hypothetical protein